jgi:hypothetical protein
MACQEGHLEFVKRLHGPSCSDRCGTKAMRLAVLCSHLEVVRFLFNTCDRKVSPQTKQCACDYGDRNITDFFVSVGVLKYSEDASDSDGETSHDDADGVDDDADADDADDESEGFTSDSNMMNKYDA